MDGRQRLANRAFLTRWEGPRPARPLPLSDACRMSVETPRPALPARPSFRRAGVSPGQACDYSSSGGVSAASANAFIEQRGVTYFNSHLFLAVVFIWNEGLAVRFGGELDTKFITKRQENEGAGNSARPFSPNTSQGKWSRAQSPGDSSACFDRGRRRGAAPSASSAGTAQRAAGCCTLSAKALELFFLVCLFLLPSHARNCQGRDIRLSVFNIIGLGRGACGPPPALGGVSRGSRCRADGLGAVQTDFLSGEAVHWGGA